jgi:DNA-directed RNA polymerase specialized sigma24 family protein
VLAIARRACTAATSPRQRHRRTPAATDPGVVLDHAGTAELRILSRDLDPDQRRAFVLTQLLGVRYGEAAYVCYCPIETRPSARASPTPAKSSPTGSTTSTKSPDNGRHGL